MAGAMLTTSARIVMISEGILSFCDDAFSLSLSVAALETVGIAVESLDHFDRITADVQ